MGSSLAITAVFEAVLFIWGSVLCCKSGACCCSGSYQPVSMTNLAFRKSLTYIMPYINQKQQLKSYYLLSTVRSQHLGSVNKVRLHALLRDKGDQAKCDSL